MQYWKVSGKGWDALLAAVRACKVMWRNVAACSVGVTFCDDGQAKSLLALGFKVELLNYPGQCIPEQLRTYDTTAVPYSC